MHQQQQQLSVLVLVQPLHQRLRLHHQLGLLLRPASRVPLVLVQQPHRFQLLLRLVLLLRPGSRRYCSARWVWTNAGRF